MSKNYIILDWAGNVMPWGSFNEFEDAWSFIYSKFDNEEDYQEYYVELIEKTRH